MQSQAFGKYYGRIEKYSDSKWRKAKKYPYHKLRLCVPSHKKKHLNVQLQNHRDHVNLLDTLVFTEAFDALLPSPLPPSLPFNLLVRSIACLLGLPVARSDAKTTRLLPFLRSLTSLLLCFRPYTSLVRSLSSTRVPLSRPATQHHPSSPHSPLP